MLLRGGGGRGGRLGAGCVRKDVGATGEMEGRGKFFGLCLSDGAFSVFQLFTWGEVEGRDDAFV